MTAPEPLDCRDEKALGAWMAALYKSTEEAAGLAARLPRYKTLSREEHHRRLADALGEIVKLFGKVGRLLKIGGAPETTYNPLAGPATWLVMAEHEARVAAKWEERQAKLAPHKRRTLDQVEADEEQAMGGKLRASRKDGGP